MALEVLEPGTLTTIQDGGRYGWARYGIPPSGPMDPVAFSIANLLVGNPPNAAALEITLTGPTLRATQDTLIAVCGATFELTVGQLSVPMWHAIFVRRGYLIRFGKRVNAARAYLAVSGGIDVPCFLGSRSTYLRGGFGGLDGRALRQGDRLPVGPSSIQHPFDYAGRSWPVPKRPPYPSSSTLRVLLGPQEDHFPPEAVQRFLDQPYEVTSSSDRMGIRLRGTPIVPRDLSGIVSDGIVTGCIQVPPDGQPIVMMVDHQTTGGYPKIATIAQVDLPLLAQCLPGDSVRFTAITVAKAVELYRAQNLRR